MLIKMQPLQGEKNDDGKLFSETSPFVLQKLMDVSAPQPEQLIYDIIYACGALPIPLQSLFRRLQ